MSTCEHDSGWWVFWSPSLMQGVAYCAECGIGKSGKSVTIVDDMEEETE